MNADIKARWLEALRSDKYPQGQEKLAQKNPDGSLSFCCLGVLCEIAQEDGITKREIDHEGPVVYVEYDGNESFLPVKVAEWAGVAYNGYLALGVNVANMNDEGRTFAEIADVIEAHA